MGFGPLAPNIRSIPRGTDPQNRPHVFRFVRPFCGLCLFGNPMTFLLYSLWNSNRHFFIQKLPFSDFLPHSRPKPPPESGFFRLLPSKFLKPPFFFSNPSQLSSFVSVGREMFTGPELRTGPPSLRIRRHPPFPPLHGVTRQSQFASSPIPSAPTPHYLDPPGFLSSSPPEYD